MSIYRLEIHPFRKSDLKRWTLEYIEQKVNVILFNVYKLLLRFLRFTFSRLSKF